MLSSHTRREQRREAAEYTVACNGLAGLQKSVIFRLGFVC